MHNKEPAEGESTEGWFIRRPGVIGSIEQLVNCARCGDRLPPKRPDQPRHFGTDPVLHQVCDGCFDALPD